TANPGILEFVAPYVEHESLHVSLAANGKLLRHHPPRRDCRKIVGRCPGLGAVLGTPVELIALEGLQGHGRVAEVLEAHLIEIAAPDIHADLAPPVILHPLQCDRTGGCELLDPVGAAAERRLERACRDIALLAR